MEKILEEINELHVAIESELKALADDTLELRELEQTHLKVERLFDTIRQEGICRKDIAALNELGLIEAEEKYYSEVRSSIGMGVALEAEGRANWMTIVLGGIIAALVALLAFIVGKFIGYFFGSSAALSSAGGKADSKTPVKLSNTKETVKIDLAKTKGSSKSGDLDVVALHTLGDKFLTGESLITLYEAAKVATKDLKETIGELSNSGELQDRLNKLVGDADLTNKDVLEKLSKDMPLSNITIDLVKSTYDIMQQVMGENLTSVSTSDRNGESLKEGTIMARSQQVCNYRASEIFSSKLTAKTEIELILDDGHVKAGVEEKDFKSLEGELKGLKKYQKEFKSGKLDLFSNSVKGQFGPATLGSKSTKFYIRKYLNYQVVYPAQYINTLVGKCLTTLMKAHLKYASIQVKVKNNAAKTFFFGDIAKIVTMVKNDKALSAGQQKDFLDRLKSFEGATITEACDILAKLAVDYDKIVDGNGAKVINISTGSSNTGLTSAVDLFSSITEI